MKLKKMYEMSLKKWKIYLDKSKKTKKVVIDTTCHFCIEVNCNCSDCRANREICDEIWGRMDKKGILLIIELIEKEIENL